MNNRSHWPNDASAALTITFDDGFADTYHETAAWLADKGLGATYYIVSRRVGTNFENIPTATWENWRQAAHLGHEIASHSATHAPMAGLFSDVRQFILGSLAAPDPRVLLRQTILRTKALNQYSYRTIDILEPINPLLEPAISRQEIEHHLPGRPVVSFSYPAGRINRAARLAVAQAGYISARGNQMGINLDVASPFALHSICIGPGLTLHELEPWLQRAIERGGWLIITFHLISVANPTQYPYCCPVEDFKRMVNRIQELPFWVANQNAVVERSRLGAKKWSHG